MIGLHKHFHQFFSHELALLNELLKKDKHPKKDWTLAHEEAFIKIKRVVEEQTLLAYPDESSPFITHIDAPNYAIVGTLLQLRADLSTGEQSHRVIGHYGLRPPKRSYSVLNESF